MITLDYRDDATVAGAIAGQWHEWNSARTPQLDLWGEIDAYIHATDTSSLEGGEYFDHKTHIPVLAELHEDLIAIVYSTIFPHEDWMSWKGYDEDAIAEAKRAKILSYIKQAHSMNGFNKTLRSIVDDFIRYGNAFGKAKYIDNSESSEDDVADGYIGPSVGRISVFDIVFNPTYHSFKKSPKIIKSLISVGEFAEMVQDAGSEVKADDATVRNLLHKRGGGELDYSERYKEQQYIPQGFGSMDQYYNSGMVELLWFYGDIYDDITGEIHKSRCICVADRSTVVFDNYEPYPSIFKAGWKNRPDNLWSQGPLDNVVGINYMVNHRENAKNEAIDKFIKPDIAYVGDVEEIYDEVTGQTKYIMPEGGSVSDIRPDATVLTFDNQIILHKEMARNAARLPQQLTGFRTEGEKTATEVQALNDGAFRGFITKAAQFEEDLLEPLVTAEIRIARDNYQSVIRVLQEDSEGVELAAEITEEDLTSNGALIPMGSRRFSRQLQQLTGINQLVNTNLGQVIGAHINTYSLAKTVEGLYGFEKFDFINKFAAMDEQVEQEKAAVLAEQDVTSELAEPTVAELEAEEAPINV